MGSLPEVLSRFQPEIEAEIKAVLAERRSPMYDMMRYHFGWCDADGRPSSASNGKAIRPTMCLLSCQALSGEYKSALPAAAAVELVHNYSLIHDDIQDDDRERRHRPTVWSVWGKPQAINAGSGMRMVANCALRRVKVTPSKYRQLQSLIDEATISLVEGQYLDLNYEDSVDITVNDYLTMVAGKTGALLGCSLEAGAIVGCDDAAKTTAFRDYGRSLGLAFQIKDDILGIWGNSDEIGKPSRNDIRRRKKTLPFILALQDAKTSQKKVLVDAYSTSPVSESAIGDVMTVLNECATLDKAYRVARSFLLDAQAAIGKLELDPGARKGLDDVAGFIESRRF